MRQTRVAHHLPEKPARNGKEKMIRGFQDQQIKGNYYFDEISRYLAIYISTILRPLTCSVVELIQLLLLHTERNAAVIPRLNGRFLFRSIYRTKRGRYRTT